MGYLALCVMSALMTLLNIGPMYWQLQQGNSGAISMGVWVLIINLKDVINTAVWYNDAINRAPVWCDISVKIGLGSQIGLVCSVMCITRFLADVVSPRATAITRLDRRHRAIFDYSLSFGAPVLVMACHIIYQPDRFFLVRQTGPNIPLIMTWPTLILWLIWPPVIAGIGVLYAVYVVYRLIKHRRDFKRVVAGAHSALTTTRFIRLALLAFSYLAVGLPLTIFTCFQNIASSGVPFDYSWTYLHSTWSKAPILIIEDTNVSSLPLWSDVISGALFFAAFGFGTEALALYTRFAKVVGLEGCLAKMSRATNVHRAKQNDTLSSSRWQSNRLESHQLQEASQYGGPFHVDYSRGGDAPSAPANGVKISVQREEDIV